MSVVAVVLQAEFINRNIYSHYWIANSLNWLGLEEKVKPLCTGKCTLLLSIFYCVIEVSTNFTVSSKRCISSSESYPLYLGLVAGCFTLLHVLY